MIKIKDVCERDSVKVLTNFGQDPVVGGLVLDVFEEVTADHQPVPRGLLL